MEAGVKPIQTNYRGYKTRSRLEARWMVYLDTVGLDFEYEPEGFEFDNGKRYLPDFWLPNVQSWAEVKPMPLTMSEMDSCAQLVKATGYGCVLLVGSPEAQPYERLFVLAQQERDHRHRPIALPPGIGLCDAKIDTEYVSERRFYICTGNGEIADRDVLKAVQAARSARFEFGESGPPR